MYGVILWSDPDAGQAVIWCEEQGDLVYYEAPGHPGHLRRSFFDTGDYVEFEVTEENSRRRARNAQTVMSAQDPIGIGPQAGADPLPQIDGRRSREAAVGQVVALSDHLAAQVRPVGMLSRRG